MNDIKLNSLQLSEFYGSKLVILDSGVPIGEMGESSTEPKTLGENKKNVLVVVNYPGASYMPDDVLTFLTSILTACKLGIGDVAIFNMNEQLNFQYKDLIKQLKTTRTLLFGIEPEQFGLPLSFPLFQVQVFTGCTYLYAPSLDECRDDKMLKGKLWLVLKKIFNLP